MLLFRAAIESTDTATTIKGRSKKSNKESEPSWKTAGFCLCSWKRQIQVEKKSRTESTDGYNLSAVAAMCRNILGRWNKSSPTFSWATLWSCSVCPETLWDSRADRGNVVLLFYNINTNIKYGNSNSNLPPDVRNAFESRLKTQFLKQHLVLQNCLCLLFPVTVY